MKKKNLKHKLVLSRKVISRLNHIRGGLDAVIIDFNTNLENCTALTKNRLTCQTGLHFTCDHSYRVCPEETKIPQNF
ncbi:hypothetical protein ACJD0Z_11260 [Flavobacteriaceae bacterium M23B6Z8]